MIGGKRREERKGMCFGGENCSIHWQIHTHTHSVREDFHHQDLSCARDY